METKKYRLKFNQILLLMMMSVHVTQATFVQNLYKKLEPGQNITGQIGAEHKGISHIECSTQLVYQDCESSKSEFLVFCLKQQPVIVHCHKLPYCDVNSYALHIIIN